MPKTIIHQFEKIFYEHFTENWFSPFEFPKMVLKFQIRTSQNKKNHLLDSFLLIQTQFWFIFCQC
jgi:hypothetical protein